MLTYATVLFLNLVNYFLGKFWSSSAAFRAPQPTFIYYPFYKFYPLTNDLTPFREKHPLTNDLTPFRENSIDKWLNPFGKKFVISANYRQINTQLFPRRLIHVYVNETPLTNDLTFFIEKFVISVNFRQINTQLFTRRPSNPCLCKRNPIDEWPNPFRRKIFYFGRF